MSKTSVAPAVKTLVEPLVSEAGLYLEDIYVSANAGLVRITVDLPDGPGAVDSDTLNQLTRAISTALDEADPIENAYTLEVSTPGAERQLTQPRHYRRCLGRKIRVKTAEGQKMEGRVLEADEHQVTIELDGGDKTSVPIDKITKARSQVEFNPGGE
ncbi:MAG: ribosome maturation factor RimP [Actinomycetaceae bacterium]|nr:ribosome maturation factor RimP [Actinomycetaceae bacterium]